MKMIVGLGNIGKKYDETRHNVGFMIVDRFAKQQGIKFDKQKFDALIATTFINNEKILLVKPLTYMNESGRAVRPLMDYFEIPVDNIIVVHDDMDLEVGKLRLRQKGSAGGHNGIKSIIAHLGTQQFKRLKIGIDHPRKMSVVDWVLSKFNNEQKVAFDSVDEQALDALEYWIKNDDFMQTMNNFNHNSKE